MTNDKILTQINDCLGLLKHVLGNNLLGVYVYGSYLMGGLQKFSDIDIFAISKRETTKEEKRMLAQALLKISGIYAVSKDIKPIELTIVVHSHVHPWQYPPAFDFLYGDWMRKEFEAGVIEPWPTKELPNLALVITQLLLSHQVLFGSDPHILLDAVPYKDFLHASTNEIDSLLGDIDWDTRNVLLTLARIWSTVETNTIRSKADAASWAMNRLPKEYKPLMQKAKSIMLGEEDEHWEDVQKLIKPCAEFMIEQIKKQLEIILASDYSNASIRLHKV